VRDFHDGKVPAGRLLAGSSAAALLPGGLEPEPAQSIWSGEGRLDSFAKRRIDVSFFEVTYWYFLVGRRICPGGNAKGR